MRDLDTLVMPDAVAVDPEGAGETGVAGRRSSDPDGGHATGASSSKLTLAKVTVPSGSGH